MTGTIHDSFLKGATLLCQLPVARQLPVALIENNMKKGVLNQNNTPLSSKLFFIAI